MTVAEVLEIRTEPDIVSVRQAVRARSVSIGLSLIDQTKLVTAASELARNTLQHGGGGQAVLEILDERGRKGVRVTFADHGPGIPDLELALRDGYTSAGGLGIGLGG